MGYRTRSRHGPMRRRAFKLFIDFLSSILQVAFKLSVTVFLQPESCIGRQQPVTNDLTTIFVQ
jgi:hypothetical protein